jgi:hypothetical protein
LSRTGKASVLIDGPSELALVERVSAVRQLFEGLVSQGVKAYVDGFSDVQSLPRDVMQALERLRDISPKNHRGFRRAEKTYMAIPVNLEELSQRNAFLLFAPYAIHAELVWADESSFVIVDDTSTSIEIIEDRHNMAALEASLPRGLSLRWID